MSELVTRLKIEDVLIVIIGVDKSINIRQLSCVTYGVVLTQDALNEYCSYKASKYGPTSDIVDHTLEQLEKDSAITISDDVALTERGRDRRREILEPKDGHPSKFLEPTDIYDTGPLLPFIEYVKKGWDGLTEDELYVLTCCTRPEFVLESDIHEKLKPHKEEIMIKIAKDAKISIGVFARCMGLDYVTGYRTLRDNGY